MSLYKWLYIFSICLVSLICVTMIPQAILESQWLWVVIPSVVIVLLWFGLYYMLRGSVGLSLVMTCLLCICMLSELGNRSLFVIRNNSFEGPDGYGSPMAFLLGLAFELFWFLFFFIVAMCGFRALRSKRNESRPIIEVPETD